MSGRKLQRFVGAQIVLVVLTTAAALLGSAFSARWLDTVTAFGAENNGTWAMADWDHDGEADLVYIKTRNTDSHMVEVHVATAASRFGTLALQVPTVFGLEDNGTWTMTDWDRDGVPDLAYIKTRNTDSHMVEIHIASGASNFHAFTVHRSTALGLEDNGIWTMADWDRDGVPDLAYIKTRNTDSHMVEVHIASGASNFQTLSHLVTAFGSENNGTWMMDDWDHDRVCDLVYIKTSNTESQVVEVHVAMGNSKFTNIFHSTTVFGPEDDGTWTMAARKLGAPLLTFIKTSNVPNVELHIAGDTRPSRPPPPPETWQTTPATTTTRALCSTNGSLFRCGPGTDAHETCCPGGRCLTTQGFGQTTWTCMPAEILCPMCQ